jgi:hypothetical protein
MNPNDMQNLINAQQQAIHQAEFQMYFLGYRDCTPFWRRRLEGRN